MIGLRNVYKSYGERKVLTDFSLEFEKDRITAILGSSGVGKTTILRLLSGLATADSGEVFGAKPVSFVFQEDRLVPHLTVNQNLELVLGKGDYSAALEEIGLGGRGGDFRKTSAAAWRGGFVSCARASSRPSSFCSTSRSRGSI